MKERTASIIFLLPYQTNRCLSLFYREPPPLNLFTWQGASEQSALWLLDPNQNTLFINDWCKRTKRFNYLPLSDKPMSQSFLEKTRAIVSLSLSLSHDINLGETTFFWPFHCNISSLYRVLARRIIRTAVRWANDDFLRELVNIIIRRDGGDSDRDGLILHNNALPSNPHVVSTSNYIYYLLLLFFFLFFFLSYRWSDMLSWMLLYIVWRSIFTSYILTHKRYSEHALL